MLTTFIHTVALINYRSSFYNIHSATQLVQVVIQKISHLCKFGYMVYVPIPLPQRTAMDPLKQVGIYVGYEIASIIRYLEPTTRNLHTTRFADCIFYEIIFHH